MSGCAFEALHNSSSLTAVSRGRPAAYAILYSICWQLKPDALLGDEFLVGWMHNQSDAKVAR